MNHLSVMVWCCGEVEVEVAGARLLRLVSVVVQGALGELAYCRVPLLTKTVRTRASRLEYRRDRQTPAPIGRRSA